MIYIGNKRIPETLVGTQIYVGRPSPLGNPFPIRPSKFSDKIYTLKDSLALYRKWLWNKLKGSICSSAYIEIMSAALTARNEDITLVCWCVNRHRHGECHARIIKSAIQWINSRIDDYVETKDLVGPTTE